MSCAIFCRIFILFSLVYLHVDFFKPVTFNPLVLTWPHAKWPNDRCLLAYCTLIYGLPPATINFLLEICNLSNTFTFMNVRSLKNGKLQVTCSTRYAAVS